MAKSIMIQGTSSGVGKSILSSALCRILKQDGYKVAPFKSQNMSSNYHLLPNGDKMARSQALAAYASGCTPSTDLNPILIMPTDNQTTVIVNGKTIGNMFSKEYSQYKKEAFNQVLSAYSRLDNEYDVIVVEGAGSPVEMNLVNNDIVNMGLAQKINSPVLLVSDIIRGGVFASLYGTMMLFTQAQRNLVKGLVVNKFKGNIEYFSDGKAIIENLCGKSVVGIVPYTQVKIEDEDSLTDFNSNLKTKQILINENDNKDTNDYLSLLDKEFDKLAGHFRKNLDMKKIYEIIERGV
ncbi:MAG: cobyric acid synthase [Oscillospiraceae bacterium]